jgi:hypothetical protein
MCDQQCLSSSCSDHAPLLLRIDGFFVRKKRFIFRSFWTRLPVKDVIARAWHYPLNGTSLFARLDWLLRNTARALQSWSAYYVGLVRMQLEMAKEVVLRLESAHDRSALAAYEEDLRQLLKLKSLPLASLQWTIAHQESRLLWLREGDTPTKLFHVHSSHRRHKGFIRSLEHRGQILVQEESKVEAAFGFFNGRLGEPTIHSYAINLEDLDLPQLDLSELGNWFTEEEVWGVIRSLPPDNAPGPDGFTARFLQYTWDIVRPELMRAFDAFWHMESRCFHTVNEALLTLLSKKAKVVSLNDYPPPPHARLLGAL